MTLFLVSKDLFSSPFASWCHLQAACVYRGCLVLSVPRTRLILKPPEVPPSLTCLPLRSPKPHQEQHMFLRNRALTDAPLSSLRGGRRVSLTFPVVLKTKQKAVLKKKTPNFNFDKIAYKNTRFLIHLGNKSSFVRAVFREDFKAFGKSQTSQMSSE